MYICIKKQLNIAKREASIILWKFFSVRENCDKLIWKKNCDFQT